MFDTQHRYADGGTETLVAPETPDYYFTDEYDSKTGISDADGTNTFQHGGERIPLNWQVRLPSLQKAIAARQNVLLDSQVHKTALNPYLQETILLQIFRVTREDAMLRRMLDISEFKPNAVFALFALRLAQSARWQLDKPIKYGIGPVTVDMSPFNAIRSRVSRRDPTCKPVDSLGLSKVCANSLVELKDINDVNMSKTYSIARTSITRTLIKVAELCCDPQRQESTVIMAALAFPREWRTVVQGNVFSPHPGEMNGLWQLFRTEFCDVTMQTVGRIDELIVELTSDSISTGIGRKIWFSNYATVHKQVANALQELKRLILHINTLSEQNTQAAIRIQEAKEQRAKARRDV